VEKKTTKVEEVEQPMDFSLLAHVEGGFFDVEVDFPNILIIVPTKA
jgi:hypothetical protein